MSSNNIWYDAYMDDDSENFRYSMENCSTFINPSLAPSFEPNGGDYIQYFYQGEEEYYPQPSQSFENYDSWEPSLEERYQSSSPYEKDNSHLEEMLLNLMQQMQIQQKSLENQMHQQQKSLENQMHQQQKNLETQMHQFAITMESQMKELETIIMNPEQEEEENMMLEQPREQAESSFHEEPSSPTIKAVSNRLLELNNLFLGGEEEIEPQLDEIQPEFIQVELDPTQWALVESHVSSSSSSSLEDVLNFNLKPSHSIIDFVFSALQPQLHTFMFESLVGVLVEEVSMMLNVKKEIDLTKVFKDSRHRHLYFKWRICGSFKFNINGEVVCRLFLSVLEQEQCGSCLYIVLSR
ncbi:hypothetical protein M5689_005380 [Euphorbia peplus]|nr:hypothetical protein M5689_005380 [Euphorbia peplus]